MKNLYEQFRTGLSRTRSAFLGRLKDTISKSSAFNDELIEKIEQSLIESDIGVETTFSLIDELNEHYKKQNKLDFTEFQEILKKKLLENLGERSAVDIGNELLCEALGSSDTTCT